MKIAIIGYGKMGKTIEALAKKKGHDIVLKINDSKISKQDVVILKNVDVAIEFSQPEGAFENIKSCLEHGVPVISGTTGWLEKMDEAIELCKKHDGAFFYASNYSVGVNIFFEINKALATMMNQQPQYDIQLEEIHHTQKLDAPSGTAISLAKDILKNIDRKQKWVNSNNNTSTELAIRSKRIDQVPGTHIIEYISPVDTIEIKHTAHSRQGFANGALAAAEWIIGRKGFFGMNDLLGF